MAHRDTSFDKQKKNIRLKSKGTHCDHSTGLQTSYGSRKLREPLTAVSDTATGCRFLVFILTLFQAARPTTARIQHSQPEHLRSLLVDSFLRDSLSTFLSSGRSFFMGRFSIDHILCTYKEGETLAMAQVFLPTVLTLLETIKCWHWMDFHLSEETGASPDCFCKAAQRISPGWLWGFGRNICWSMPLRGCVVAGSPGKSV